MTPASLSTQNILKVISDEALGFKFGKPDRPSEKSLACILPILRTTSHKRQYVTMPETEHLLVTDSGSIYKLNLKNSSKENIFVRSGTIFEGKGTQSRALTRSAVIFPGQEVGLDVRCVHQSHGIRSGSEFKYGGVTPFSVESSNYAAGYRPKDQSNMWKSVETFTTTSASMTGREPAIQTSGSSLRSRLQRGQARGLRTMRSSGQSVQTHHSLFSNPDSSTAWNTSSSNAGGIYSSHLGATEDSFDLNVADPMLDVPSYPSSDNLKASFDEFAKNFDDILSKARLHDNQAGLALITDTGCKTVEAYDVPLSWESLHRDAVKRMGTELLRGPDNTSVFEYKPENAIAAVRKVLALPFKANQIYEHKPSNGEPHIEIFGLTAGNYVGEVVELDGRVIHLVLIETAQA
jgi:hypothetical protein